MQHIAFVEMGLSADEFGWMTPYLFAARRKHLRNEKIEVWDQLRWHAAIVANYGGLGQSKPIQPSDLLHIPDLDGEKQARIPEVIDDQKELQEINRLLALRGKKNGSN